MTVWGRQASLTGAGDSGVWYFVSICTASLAQRKLDEGLLTKRLESA
jgi:hypothetical protein